MASDASLKRPWILGTAAVAVVALVTAFSLLPHGFSLRSDKAAVPITFQLPWTHTGSFAGYYSADQNGYFAEEGLSVRFLTGGYNVNPIDSVLNGQAEIGAANANLLIKARAEGKPLRVVAAIHHRNPVVFITLPGSGLKHPQDFAGKTVHVSVQNIPIFQAVMNRVGVPLDGYEIVQESNHSRFFAGEVDVWVGFLFYSTQRIEKAGYGYNLIHPDDYGVHFYQNCIFTTEDYLTEHPERVERFLRATLRKGWAEAMRDPQSAAALTATYDPKADIVLETDFLTAMIPLINTGDSPIGWMKPEIWEAMTKSLQNVGVVSKPIDPEQVYTMRFLEEIYGDGK